MSESSLTFIFYVGWTRIGYGRVYENTLYNTMKSQNQALRILHHKRLWLLLLSLMIAVFHNTTMVRLGRTNIGLVLVNQLPFPVSLSEKPLNTALQAERLLKTASDDAENQSVWPALGFALWAQGKEQEALSIWEKTSLSPAQIFVSRGDYARFFNQKEKARKIYDAALRLDPTEGSAWYGIGMIEKTSGRTNEAINAFQKAWEWGNVNSAHQLASLLRDQQNYEAAIDIWQQALASYPAYPYRQRWWRGLSNSYHATAQWELGVQQTQKALKEFPDDPQLYTELGFMLYKVTGDTGIAQEILQRAIELSNNPAYAYSLLGNIMTQEERYQEAYTWYDKALELQPDKLSWQIAQAHAARASGELVTAQTEFEEIIEQHPNFAAAYYGLALVYQLQEDWENAAPTITQALELSPVPTTTNYLKAGEIYEQAIDYENALWAYQQILMLEPTNRLALEKTHFIQTKLRENKE
ncbi:MAG TPA: tetratricopeptide repeat protein [Anaerolineae bacterium]|nr:tetratricopeptide repeat protein [Anaerolineae bacterium]